MINDDDRKDAEEFVESLFTNGSKQKADRLVLTVDSSPKKDLGGLCRGAVIDRLLKLLEHERKRLSEGEPDGWVPAHPEKGFDAGAFTWREEETNRTLGEGWSFVPVKLIKLEVK